MHFYVSAHNEMDSIFFFPITIHFSISLVYLYLSQLYINPSVPLPSLTQFSPPPSPPRGTFCVFFEM